MGSSVSKPKDIKILYEGWTFELSGICCKSWKLRWTVFYKDDGVYKLTSYYSNRYDYPSITIILDEHLCFDYLHPIFKYNLKNAIHISNKETKTEYILKARSPKEMQIWYNKLLIPIFSAASDKEGMPDFTDVISLFETRPDPLKYFKHTK